MKNQPSTEVEVIDTSIPGAKLIFMITLVLFILFVSLAILNFSLGGQEIITNLLLAIGTTCGPLSIMGLFLKAGFEPIIKEAAKECFKHEITNIRSTLDTKMQDCKKHSQELLDNSQTLSELRESGITGIFPNRNKSLGIIKKWLNDNSNEIFIFVGTSFRGLYWEKKGDPEILKKIKDLAEAKPDLVNKTGGYYLRFLFTHPAFAYLRESSEGCEREDSQHFKIREEILESVLKLRSIGIPEHCIKFWKGTPTMFGVQTDHGMLINPYPNKSQSFTSVSIHLEPNKKGHTTPTLYDFYSQLHFKDAWNDVKNTDDWKDEKLDEFWCSSIHDISKEKNHSEDLPSKLKKLKINLTNNIIRTKNLQNTFIEQK